MVRLTDMELLLALLAEAYDAGVHESPDGRRRLEVVRTILRRHTGVDLAGWHITPEVFDALLRTGVSDA